MRKYWYRKKSTRYQNEWILFPGPYASLHLRRSLNIHVSVIRRSTLRYVAIFQNIILTPGVSFKRHEAFGKRKNILTANTTCLISFGIIKKIRDHTSKVFIT